MPKYIIRIVQENDYKSIAEIYNSNPHFLFHHLGVDFIDEAFVSEEVSTMQKAGFHSCVIVDQESSMVQGVLDYKPNQEVYLSLLMLSASLQGKGMGSDIYSHFEMKMIQDKKTSIRIDVVNDYQDHLVPFWKRHGFLENENVTLDWGNKKSSAVVMRKNFYNEIIETRTEPPR